MVCRVLVVVLKFYSCLSVFDFLYDGSKASLAPTSGKRTIPSNRLYVGNVGISL